MLVTWKFNSLIVLIDHRENFYQVTLDINKLKSAGLIKYTITALIFGKVSLRLQQLVVLSKTVIVNVYIYSG